MPPHRCHISATWHISAHVLYPLMRHHTLDPARPSPLMPRLPTHNTLFPTHTHSHTLIHTPTPHSTRFTDVFTLNHYSTHLVRDVGGVASTAGDAIGQAAYSAWAADQKISSTFDESWPESESPWLRSYPPGFRALLAWAAGPHSGRWKGAMYVTENGWSCHSMTAEEAKRDQEQVRGAMPSCTLPLPSASHCAPRCPERALPYALLHAVH